jgi:hypothetical protein
MNNKVKLLFLAANPLNTEFLQLDEEIRSITQKIQSAKYRDMIELVPAWAARPDDLLQSLNQHKPQIVHFSGHGSSAGEIILIDDNTGQAKTVNANALELLFATLKDNVRLVVLNACYSRAQAEAIVTNIDCAVGTNESISDKAAIIFAASLYRAFGFGRSVKEAFDQAKAALLLEGISGEETLELLCRPGVNPAQVYIVKSSQVQNVKEIVAGSKPHLDDLEAFRSERLSKLYLRKDPPLLNGKYPKLVLHLVPGSTFDERRIKIDLKLLEQDKRVEPLYWGVWGRPKYSRYSILKFFLPSDKNAVESSIEIFQDGTFEAIELIHSPAQSLTGGFIYPNYEEDIVKQLPQYISVLKQHGVTEPIYVALSFVEMRDWNMWIDPMRVGVLQRAQCVPFVENQIPIDFECLDNFEDVKTPEDAAHFMKPIFDVLWREAGLSGSLNYDKEGNWNR